MNYFELSKRLAVLEKFRKLYKEYLTFTNRSENPAAVMILAQLRPLTPMTLDSLREVGIGTIVAQDAPSRGQKKYKINIIKAIFRESLIQHFSLDEQAPLEAVEAAIVKYQVRRSRAKMQLFNPVFWLVVFIGYAAESPFHLLKQLGFREAEEARNTAGGKFIKLVLALVIIVFIIEVTGLRDWIWIKFSL